MICHLHIWLQDHYSKLLGPNLDVVQVDLAAAGISDRHQHQVGQNFLRVFLPSGVPVTWGIFRTDPREAHARQFRPIGFHRFRDVRSTFRRHSPTDRGQSSSYLINNYQRRRSMTTSTIAPIRVGWLFVKCVNGKRRGSSRQPLTHARRRNHQPGEESSGRISPRKSEM